MMKKLTAALLALLIFAETMGVAFQTFSIDDLLGVFSVCASALGSGETAADPALTEFNRELGALLEDYPVDNAYSKITVDIERNTIQKDDEAAVPLSEYDADYSAVNSNEPVLPAVAVLSQDGVEAELDEDSGKVTANIDGREESFEFAPVDEEIESQISSGDAEVRTEDGVQTISADGKLVTREAGYMTSEQAQENFGFESEYKDGKITVTNPYQAKRLIAETKNGRRIKNKYGAVRIINDGAYNVLQFDSEKAAREAYEQLENDSGISYVSTDNVVRVTALSEREGADCIQSDRYKQYLKKQGKNQQVVVAVVDTGVDTKHSFLQGRLLKGANFSGENAKDNYSDKHGHGTHVSGIVVDNTPSNVKILPVKSMKSSGSGTSLSIKMGIDYAVSNGAKVINLSLGCMCDGVCEMDKAVKAAVKKGVTVVVAAGNDSADTKEFCPAKNEECVTVAASSKDAMRTATFSNYGKAVDVAAPGEGILSCKTGGGYVAYDGTSMATPFVAAAAAMLLTDNVKLSPAQVHSKLRSSCSDIYTKGWDRYSGCGMLNLGILLGDKDIYSDYLDIDTEEVNMKYFSKAATVLRNPVLTVITNDKRRVTDGVLTISNTAPDVAVFDGKYITAKKAGKTKITVRYRNLGPFSFNINVTKKEVWIDYAAQSYAGGDGSKDNPYLIKTAAQLAKFAKDIRQKHSANKKSYKLIADIDLKGKDWITAAYTPPYTQNTLIIDFDGDYNFAGVFDGNNHKIKNMTVFSEIRDLAWKEDRVINGEWYTENGGFIGEIQKGAIKNLGIENAYCTNLDSGILCKYILQESKVENCYTTGFSAGSGIARYISNYNVKIKNCFSSAEVVRNGIADHVYSSMSDGNVVVSNTYFCGKIIGSSKSDRSANELGNLFGYIESNPGYNHTKIYNCFTAVSDKFRNSFANKNIESSIYNCYKVGSEKAIGSTTGKTKNDIKTKSVSFFKDKKNYTDSSNWNSEYKWDFKNTWAIDPKVNNGFPYLKKMKPGKATSPYTGTWLDNAASSFAGGNGTKDSPYLISNANQLARLAKLYRFGGGEGTYYKLTNDIDLSAKPWMPIGIGPIVDNKGAVSGKAEFSSQRYYFKGNIDGNGKTIKGMRIESSGNYIGFISCMVTGEISNLSFTDSTVSGYKYVGGICGDLSEEGSIISCSFSGKIIAQDIAGGICASSTGGLSSILGCTANFDAYIDPSYNGEVGGICADSYGRIENCSVKAKLVNSQNSGHCISPIYAAGNTVSKNCFSIINGDIGGNSVNPAQNSYYIYNDSMIVYGNKISFDGIRIWREYEPEYKLTKKHFAGFNFGDSWQESSSAYGYTPKLKKKTFKTNKISVPAASWRNFAAKSFTAGNGTKKSPYLISTAGQLVKAYNMMLGTEDKRLYFRLIRNIDLSGKRWLTEEIGGYRNYSNYNFDGNNKTVSNMISDNGQGLLCSGNVGRIENLKLTNISGYHSCGIIAYNNGKISNCQVSGTFIGSYTSLSDHRSYVGGICCHNSEDGVIERCTVNCNISGWQVGGIAEANYGTIRNCVIKGNLINVGSADAIAPRMWGTVKNCYSIAKTRGASFPYSSQQYISTYEIAPTNADYTPSSTIKTLNELKKQSTYKGWDFKNVWAMNPKVNGGLPYIREKPSKKIKYVLPKGASLEYGVYDYISGTNVVLPKASMKGKVFKGWYTSADCKGKAIWSLTEKAGSNVTLYPKWAKGYNVVLVSGKKKAEIVLPRNEEVVIPNKLTKTGHTLVGWATKEGGKVKYKAGKKVKNLAKSGKTVTLYAVWRPNKYKLVLHMNGDKKTVKLKYGETYKLPKYDGSGNGSYAVGWKVDKKLGVKYKDGAKVKNLTSKDGDTVHLYLSWKTITYTVKFSANGGSGKMKSVKMTYNDPVKLPKNTFTAPKGKKFAGWATSKKGKVVYKNKQTVVNLVNKKDGSIKLYAVWKTAGKKKK